jgi:hypothetical protein
MDRIDRQTQKVISERVSELGGGADAPRPFTPPTLGDRSGGYTRQPGTVNPPAEVLRFDPAAESRDVASILDAYADDAIEGGPDALMLDLDAVFRLADASSREHRQAEEDFILTVISLLVERHQWTPRLFNDTTVGLSGQGDDGTFDAAMSVINTLRVSQRLPYGGSVEARWVTRAAQELVNESTNAYTSSSELILSGSMPLLRGAGRVAREDLIQAERNTVYAARTYERFRRQLLVSIAADYFSLLQTRARIGNQRRQLESQIRRQDGRAAQPLPERHRGQRGQAVRGAAGEPARVVHPPARAVQAAPGARAGHEDRAGRAGSGAARAEHHAGGGGVAGAELPAGPPEPARPAAGHRAGGGERAEQHAAGL